MSTGDVPRCPSCGLYLYPSDTATVHLCGVQWPNNAPASYPLKDWRDAEIESLRERLAALEAAAQKVQQVALFDDGYALVSAKALTGLHALLGETAP